MILNILLAIAFFYMLYRISVIVHECFKDLASEEENQDWWSYSESQRRKSEKKKKRK